MSDLYGMDVKADYEMRMAIYRYRRWPHWVCWLFGHEVVQYTDDYSRDHWRCLCGTHEVSGREYVRVHRGRWWASVVNRAFRWLW